LIDFLFEIFLQLVFELILEGIMRLLAAGLSGVLGTTASGCAAFLGSTAGRIALLAAAGFAFGVYWGNHLSGLRGHRPRLLLVSVVLAVGFAGLALWRWTRTRTVQNRRDAPATDLAVWRWPPSRLVGAAALNAAIAAGIVTGFTPGVPG
jgi:hypothetical protein